MQTDCQAARNDVRQADMMSGRKADCKAGTQSAKRTDILPSGKTDCKDFQASRRTFKQADRQIVRHTYYINSVKLAERLLCRQTDWRQTDFKTGRQADRESGIHADNKSAVKMLGMPATL
jgi:hypothetical protein